MGVLKWMRVIAKPRLLLAAAGLLLTGAIGDGTTSYSYPPSYPPAALTVYVRQADGTPVVGATVTAIGVGGAQEVFREWGDDPPFDWWHLYYALTPAGVYSVHVEAAGYAPATIDGIQILEGEFLGGSVFPVDVLVKLTRLPAGGQATEVSQ
jgi:hypothetical protein